MSKFNSDLEVSVKRMRQGRIEVRVSSRVFPHLEEVTVKTNDADALHMLETFKARVARRVEERKAAMRSAGDQTEARQSIFAD